MANYKAVDTDQLEADLTNIADAIREKTEDTEKLSMAAMAQTIRAMPGLITAEAAGGSILLTDATDLNLRGLTLYGKTIQNGTPSPDAPVPLVSAGDGGSIAVSVLGENMLYPELFEQGSLLANGSETNSTTRLRSRYVYVKPNQLYSLKADGLLLYELMEFDDTRSMLKLNSISAAEFTFTTAAGTKAIRLLLRHADNTSVTTVSDIAHIQMAAGSAVSENLPYREPQTLTVPTPNGLPGIPVTSGGNYTDSTGQQWVCDEMDFDRGVYVQRVKKVVFNGTESWTFSSSFNAPFGIRIENLASCTNTDVMLLCDKYPAISIHDTWVNYDYLVSKQSVTTPKIFFRNTDVSTLDEWKAALAENPITLQYILATPIETPLSVHDLSALHTHYPNTTVFNDGGAGMAVKYVADTKLYIDKKFAELSAALLNQ